MMLVSNRRRSMRGFTLIELMVVLVILGTMLSLVGPLAVSNVDKAKVTTEIAQLNNWITKVSLSAYYKGFPIIASFEGKQIRVFAEPVTRFDDKEEQIDHQPNETEIIDKIEFDVLFFQPQQIQFNKNGFPLQDTLRYQLNNSQIELSVLDIVYQRNEN
ncbi:type II secretion system protein [Vibrio rotiferianus]|uniref:type II secretion system protein n=1 Tax=Vibrio rotiferianus TaxID=190895 RepID=UPI00289602AC|nr:conserved hypothetical protein [Vibrio rotiferianus]